MTLEAFALLCKPNGPIRIVVWNDDMYEYVTLYEFNYCDGDSFLEEVRKKRIRYMIVNNISVDWDTEDMDVPAALAIEVKSL